MVHIGFAVVFGFIGLVAILCLFIALGWLTGHIVRRLWPVAAWVFGLFVALPWVIGHVVA